VAFPQRSTLRSFGRQQAAITACLLAGLCLSLSGCGSFAAQGHDAEGVRLFQQARYQDAVREFQTAAYEDPNDADAYYNIAATYHRLAKLEKRPSDLSQAECYYNQCLDRNPNHTECYRGLAVLLAEQNRKDDAFTLLDRWMQRQPASADAKIELARLNDEYGNRQAAQDLLNEALVCDPTNPRTLTALGKLREDAGDKAQALANYQRSLAEDSRQPLVASRVSALQGGPASPTSTSSTAPVYAGTTPAAPASPTTIAAPPTIELGTRMADRSSSGAPK
jgi:tetratricopeptide (TPR) repeat protein